MPAGTDDTTVTFDGWEKGEFGNLGSREAAKQAIGLERRTRLSPGYWLPSGFTGKNVMRVRGGLVAPRPGVLNLGVTGLGNGKLKALGAGNAGTIAVIGSTVYSFDASSAGNAATTWTMTDSISDTFNKPGEMAGGFSVEYVLTNGGFAYKLVNSTHTCAKVAGATPVPSGRCVEFFQDRMLIGGTPANPQRLFYSDPGGTGWDNFPAANYLDLPGFAISCMYPFRSGLLVGTASGAFAYITGTLGSSEVVRTLSRQGAPADTRKGVLLDSDEVAFMALDRPHVEVYNGAIHTDQKLLRFAGDHYQTDSSETPTYGAVKLVGPDDWLFLSGLATPAPPDLSPALNRALLHYDGVHSYHTWEQNIGAWTLNLGAGRTLLVKDGDASHPPVFYVFAVEHNRPGFTSDPDAQPGDDSTTPLDAFVHPNMFFDPMGMELIVRTVTVDFRKWNTGSGTNNHFEVTARALSRYNDVLLASAAQTWDEAGSAAATTGTDARQSFNFGDQGQGSAFEVWFDALKGVAIRSFTVTFDRLPARAG